MDSKRFLNISIAELYKATAALALFFSVCNFGVVGCSKIGKVTSTSESAMSGNKTAGSQVTGDDPNSFSLLGSKEADAQVLKDAGIVMAADGKLTDSSGAVLKSGDVFAKLRTQADSYFSSIDGFLVSADTASKIETAMSSTGGTMDIGGELSRIAKGGESSPEKSGSTWTQATEKLAANKPIVQKYLATLDMLNQLDHSNIATKQEYERNYQRIDKTAAIFTIGSVQEAQRQWLDSVGAGEKAWQETAFRATRSSGYAELTFGNAAVGKPANVMDKSDRLLRSTVTTTDESQGSRVSRLILTPDSSAGNVSVRDGYVQSMDQGGVKITSNPAEAPIFRRSEGRIIVSDFDAVLSRYEGVGTTAILDDANAGKLGKAWEPAVRVYEKTGDHHTGPSEVWMSAAEAGVLQKHQEITKQAGIAPIIMHGGEDAYPLKVPGGGPDSATLAVRSDGAAQAFQPGTYTQALGKSLRPGQKLYVAQDDADAILKQTGHPLASGYTPPEQHTDTTRLPGTLLELAEGGGITRVYPSQVLEAGTFSPDSAAVSEFPRERWKSMPYPSMSESSSGAAKAVHPAEPKAPVEQGPQSKSGVGEAAAPVARPPSGATLPRGTSGH